MKTKFKEPIVIKVSCVQCGKEFEIKVELKDWYDYNHGKLVQNAFPYLTPDERELFLSGICGECWNKMFY